MKEEGENKKVCGRERERGVPLIHKKKKDRDTERGDLIEG